MPITPAEIVANMQDAVVAVGREGELAYANPSAGTLIRGQQEFDTEAWRDTLQRNAWLNDTLFGAMEKARSHVLHEVELARPRGGALPVRVRIVPLFSDDGALRGAVAVFSDERHLAVMSEGLRRDDRLRQLGVLAAGLAHEIKNPLGGILGAAQLLRGEAMTQDGAECVDVIERDVRRINRLIEELLHFGNPRSLRRVPLNPHRVVDQVLQVLRHDPVTSGHPVIRDYDPSLPDVPLDADAFQQAVMNLVRNAMEASPAGEPVVIRTRVDVLGRRFPGKAVLIDVQNGGPGIAPEVREKLFTPFFTTKTQGTGLGLAITLRLCREHGGTLEMTSEPGRTVFTMVLPMEATQALPAMEP